MSRFFLSFELFCVGVDLGYRGSCSLILQPSKTETFARMHRCFPSRSISILWTISGFIFDSSRVPFQLFWTLPSNQCQSTTNNDTHAWPWQLLLPPETPIAMAHSPQKTVRMMILSTNLKGLVVYLICFCMCCQSPATCMHTLMATWFCMQAAFELNEKVGNSGENM